MAYSYRDVLDQYDASNVSAESLPEWSARMNELTGSDLYSAGFHDSWIKRASIGIDRLLEKTQLPQLGEAAGRAIGEPLGLGEVGAQTGRGLPRMAVNLAPTLVGSLVPGVGTAAGAALTAGLAGAETYSATDSPLAGAIGGATFAATPLIGRLGGQIGLRAAGAKFLEEPILNAAGKVALPAGYYGQGAQKLAGFAGEQAGVIGALAAGHTGTELATGQPLTNPVSPESLLSLGLSALPFAAAGLAQKGISRVTRGPAMSSEQIGSLIDKANEQTALRASQKQSDTEPGTTKLPSFADSIGPPTAEQQAAQEKTQAILSQLRGEQLAIKNDPTLSEDEKIKQINNRLERESKEMQGHIPPPGSIFGNAMMPDDPRQEVLGSQVKVNEAGTHRWIYVNNDEANPPELRGKVIGYSTKDEPAPKSGLQTQETGMQRFSIPERQWWSSEKTAEEWNRRYKKAWFPAGERGFGARQVEVGQVPTEQLLGAFPKQEEMSREQLSAHMSELATLAAKVNADETPADLQRTTVELNGIEAENNLPTTSDNDLKPDMQRLVDQGVPVGDAAKTALKVKITRTQQKLQAKRDAEREPLIKAGYTNEQLDAMTPEQYQSTLDAVAEYTGERRKKAVKVEEEEAPVEEEAPTVAETQAAMTGAGRKAAAPGRKEIAKVIEEIGTGMKVVTSDKLTMGRSEPEAQSKEVTDTNTDAAIKAVQQPQVKAAFDKWPEAGEHNLARDVQDFLILTEQYGSLKNAQAHADEAAQILAESRGGISTVDEGDVLDFLNRPHVREMGLAHDRVLEGMQTANHAFVPKSSEQLNRALEHMLVRPAGNRFLFSMARYDPETNKLGGKHTLPKSGLMDEATFTKIGGVGKPLNKNEVALYKQLVPEAFNEGQVNVKILDQRLKEVGPVVETKTLGAPPADQGQAARQQRLNQVRHELETQPGTGNYSEWDFQHPDFLRQPERTQQLFRELVDLESGRAADEGRYATEGGAQYSFVAPKPEDQMPGYVEGLVRLPTTSHLEAIKQAKAEGLTDANEIEKRVRQITHNYETERALYRGPHFGAEDRNVVSFYRGYEETLPNGEKAFHVIEVQSDWGQRNRGEATRRAKLLELKESELAKNPNDKYLQGEVEGLRDIIARGPEATHPLLEVYNSLALKAAIQHAKEIGATKVILSDAETAMMTEGHDQQSYDHPHAGIEELPRGTPREIRIDNAGRPDKGRVVKITGKFEFEEGKPLPMIELENGDWVTPTSLDADLADLFVQASGPTAVVPQEKGMRLNYDQALPSAMEKLTRDKGEVVDLGTHKAATTGEKLEPPAEEGWQQRVKDAGYTVRESTVDGTYEVRDSDNITNATVQGNTLIGSTPELYSLIAPSSQAGEFKLEGSPVFKDAEGNPKTNITGRSYDISQLPGEFTLTEPNRGFDSPSYKGIQGTPFLPTEQRDIDAMMNLGVHNGGRGLVAYLASHPNPNFQNLARDLVKLVPEALDRVDASVRNIKAGGQTVVKHGDRFEIQFSPALLRTADTVQGYFVAHELLHGLTKAELYNPTKDGIRENMEGLRRKLVDALPTDMRDAYDKAIKSSWYSRYVRGEVTPESIFPKGTNDQMDVLYGLMNLDEMVSQGFSNNAMRTYMQGVKTENVTGFRKFTNFVKGLLGIGEQVSDNAFGEFLSHSGQLLERGNFVADFKNYTDRYFGNIGLGPPYADTLTQRATGVLLGLSPFSTPTEILDSLRYGAGPMRTPEYAQTSREVTRLFQQRDETTDQAQALLGELGQQPNAIGATNLAHEMMLGNVPDADAVMQTMPEPILKYITSLANDAKAVIGAVHSALEAGKGVTNVHEGEKLVAPLKALLDSIDEVRAKQDQQEVMVNKTLGFFGVPPDGAFDKMAQEPSLAPGWALQEDRQKIGTMWKWLGQIGQLSRLISESAEVFSKGFQLNTNTRKMMSEMLRPFGTNLETMEMDHNTVKTNYNAVRNPKVERAANRWIGLTQRSGTDSGKTDPIDIDNVEVKKILQGLSQKEIDQVETLMQQRFLSNRAGQQEILEKGMQIAATEGAGIVQKDVPGTKMKDAVGMSRAVLEAFTVDRSDPVASKAADAKLNNVQRQMTPEAFNSLVEFHQGEGTKWGEAKKWMDANPDWATARRYGKYLVEYVKGGKAFVDGVDSRKEAVSVAGGERNIKSFKPNGLDYEDRPPWLGPDAPAVIQKFRELDQNRRDILVSKGVMTREEALEDEKYSAVGQLAIEETYRGGIKGLQPPPRRLTKLSEDFPWLRNHFSWTQKVSSYWSRQLLRTEVRMHLLDPEIAANKDLSNLVRDHYANMLKPDTATGRFMQKFATSWFLGFSPASAIINATQPFLTHVAELTSMTGKPLASYVATIKSLKEIARNGATGKWDNPDHEWAIRESAKAGELDLAMYDDRAAYDEAIHTNWKRAMNSNRVQTMGQKLSTMAGNYSTVGLWMFRGVERINNQAAILTAFDHYRESEPNLSRDEALQKAWEFNHAVNYGGGAAQRPIAFYKGVPRTVAMLATSMQSYVLGSTGQLARYIQQGYFRPAGLKPSEVYAARTAAVQMLGTQLALAGVLGMPFVSGALALLDKAFPGLEVNKHLREWMAQISGEDGENGHVLTDIAMTGVPSMMGWDLQSRLTMGNTLPGVSEVNGFEPGRLLGAPYSLVSNFIKGGQQALTGDPHALDSFVPNGIKKLEQLVRTGGQVLDYRERPIFKPTAMETAGIALGFQPKRLSDFNAAQRISRQAQDNITRREGEFHQANAEEVLKGNFGSVRNSILQRAAEDKTFDVKDAVRNTARAAEELTFPRDLRREGTLAAGDARSRLLATFNLPQNQPSEMTRLQFRNQVERRLGLIPTVSSRDLQTAQLVDELRKRYPNQSRAQLSRQASLLLSGPRQQTLASPVE